MDICLKSRRSYEYGNAEANATGCVSLLLVHSGAWPTDPKRLRQAFPLNAMLPIRQSRPVFANRVLCFQIIPFPRLPRSPIFEEREKLPKCNKKFAYLVKDLYILLAYHKAYFSAHHKNSNCVYSCWFHGSQWFTAREEFLKH